MDYFIGIDGGGTKTSFVLHDQEGTALAEYRAGSANYKQIGQEGLLTMLQEGLQKLTNDTGLVQNGNCYTCLGLPMYRESREFDEWVERTLPEVFPQWHILPVNDCEVGWAGSLGLESGINIIAGTGSISFGRNDAGITASVGGWSDYFSDEGSCKWLGVKCMELFSKEADGRLPKGALYTIIKDAFSLEVDKDMIEIFERGYMPYRDKIASLQRYLLQAAEQGDEAAIQAYEQAAGELTLILTATAKQLKLEQEIKVTCSGGLFKTGEMILQPLREQLQQKQMILVESMFSPEQGAVLLAAEHWKGKEAAEYIKHEWGKKKCS